MWRIILKTKAENTMKLIVIVLLQNDLKSISMLCIKNNCSLNMTLLSLHKHFNELQ